MKTIFVMIIPLALFASCQKEGRKKTALVETRKMYNVATNAAVWGIPIVSTFAMREAFFRDASARYGDIIYLSKPADWKFQISTPSPSLRYAYFNFNSIDGPIVIEIPSTSDLGFSGALYDAWQVPQINFGPAGVDSGKGGKFVVIPPDYHKKIPGGYKSVHFGTYNGYGLLRILPDNNSAQAEQKSVALIKKVRVYRLCQAADPPVTNFIDMSGKLFDGIVRFDASFYDALATMLNEEP